MRGEQTSRAPLEQDRALGGAPAAPLSGIRVVDCGLAYAGPVATRFLAGLGAEVIRIDSRKATSFSVPPPWAGDLGPAAADLAAGAEALNGGKLSLGLNVGHPEARPILAALVARSDVFLTNLSVPALSSLKLHDADVREWNRQIIYVSLTGFGTAPGPYRDYRSFGPTLSALSGFDSLTGDPDRDPVTSRTPYLDFLAAYHAVVAILHALGGRSPGQEPPSYELSQFSIAASTLGAQILHAQVADELPGRCGNQIPGWAPCGLFPCRGDDQWVSIEIRTDAEWRAFCDASGLRELDADISHDERVLRQDEIASRIASWTERLTSREVAYRLQARGVSACPVQTGWDHLADPQLEARSFWRMVRHDRLGADLASSLPVRFGSAPVGITQSAPSLGHDTDTVLAGLGFAPDAIDRLVESGIAERETPVAAEFAGVTLERPSRRWAWPILGLTDKPPPPSQGAVDATAEAVDLSRCRILDLSDEQSVYGTRLLRMLGADVIRVEPPTGAPLRRQPPLHDGVSTYHQFMDAGKSSVTVDFETDEGRELFARLAATADVIYESRAVGWLASHGLGWERLHRGNPGAVLVSVTSFGQDGPYAHWHAGELGLWAMSGSLADIGYPDRPPSVPRAVAPALIGTMGAVATLAALYARQRTGRGQWVDVSGHETMVATAGSMLPQIERLRRLPRAGSQGAGVGPWGYFPCADRPVSVMAISARHWLALATWVRDETGSDAGLAPEFLSSAVTRYEHGDVIDPLVASLTRRYCANDFCEQAQSRGIVAVPLNSIADLLSDPHLERIGFWRPGPGGHPPKWPAGPFGFADQPLAPSPELGANNTHVFKPKLTSSPVTIIRS
jgi:crotonobetainyl-CoA:carnitine CoA-transferase CaiB-like acyl-CoA transferase